VIHRAADTAVEPDSRSFMKKNQNIRNTDINKNNKGNDRSKEDEDLDDFVVADMSGVERRNLIIPRMPDRYASLGGHTAGGASSPFGSKRIKHANHGDIPGYEENFDYSQANDIDKEATFWYMMGALKAGLLVAGAFIAGLGLIILLMYLFL
jgi:hypothetical protein